MRFLDPQKLHVTYLAGARPDGPLTPRRYTLTHSDRTGRLYLTIGPDYNVKQISGLYTRIMRDEVLGEWKADGDPSLNVYCHVSCGLVFGKTSWRDSIFRQELLVLETFRYGDRFLFEAYPRLDNAQIWVHFESTDPAYRKSEAWHTPARYFTWIQRKTDERILIPPMSNWRLPASSSTNMRISTLTGSTFQVGLSHRAQSCSNMPRISRASKQ